MKKRISSFILFFISHINQRQKGMEALKAQSKSTENAGNLRKRGKRGDIGGWREGRVDGVVEEDQQGRGSWKHKSDEERI